MDDIKVSVCMVTYNHERYIEQAVESVVAQQTNFPYEIVIGEDCSTDSTRSILQELARKHPDKNFHLRLAERNRGGKLNFMDTFSACRGKYVAMLEGDDYWLSPHKLQLQVDMLEARPDWAICFHPAKCIWEDGMQGQDVHPLNWERPEAKLEDLFEANFIPTSAAVFRNHLFGDFPSWFGGLLLGDWPLHILNSARGNIGFLPAVMSAYRLHRNGLWTCVPQADKLEAIFAMLSAIDHHFDGKYAVAIERFRMETVRNSLAELDIAKSSCTASATELNRANTELDQIRAQIDQVGAQLIQARSEAWQQKKIAEEEVLALEQKYQLTKDELIAVRQQIRHMEDDLRTLQLHLRSAAKELTVMQSEHQQMMAENHRLNEFYDRWSNSMAYRMIEKVHVPWTSFLRQAHRARRGSETPQPPTEITISKVA